MEKCFCDNKIKSKRDGGVLESFKNIEQVKRNGFLKWRYLWRIFQGTKWVAKKLLIMKILRKIKDYMNNTTCDEIHGEILSCLIL